MDKIISHLKSALAGKCGQKNCENKIKFLCNDCKLAVYCSKECCIKDNHHHLIEAKRRSERIKKKKREREEEEEPEAEVEEIEPAPQIIDTQWNTMQTRIPLREMSEPISDELNDIIEMSEKSERFREYRTKYTQTYETMITEFHDKYTFVFQGSKPRTMKKRVINFIKNIYVENDIETLEDFRKVFTFFPNAKYIIFKSVNIKLPQNEIPPSVEYLAFDTLLQPLFQEVLPRNLLSLRIYDYRTRTGLSRFILPERLVDLKLRFYAPFKPNILPQSLIYLALTYIGDTPLRILNALNFPMRVMELMLQGNFEISPFTLPKSIRKLKMTLEYRPLVPGVISYLKLLDYLELVGRYPLQQPGLLPRSKILVFSGGFDQPIFDNIKEILEPNIHFNTLVFQDGFTNGGSIIRGDSIPDHLRKLNLGSYDQRIQFPEKIPNTLNEIIIKDVAYSRAEVVRNNYIPELDIPEQRLDFTQEQQGKWQNGTVVEANLNYIENITPYQYANIIHPVKILYFISGIKSYVCQLLAFTPDDEDSYVVLKEFLLHDVQDEPSFKNYVDYQIGENVQILIQRENLIDGELKYVWTRAVIEKDQQSGKKVATVPKLYYFENKEKAVVGPKSFDLQYLLRPNIKKFQFGRVREDWFLK